MTEFEEKMVNYKKMIQNKADAGLITRPELKPFDTFTLPSSGWMSYGDNGYIVIPDDWSIDYNSKLYTTNEVLDATRPVHSLTFGGYAIMNDGQLGLWSSRRFGLTDKEKILKDDAEALSKFYSVKVLGFDNAHYDENSVDASTGAKAIAKVLKKVYLANKDNK